MSKKVLNDLFDNKCFIFRKAVERNNGKAVLLSIKKEWLDKIASGEKTIELRKSMPSSISFPFAVLCYETKADGGSERIQGAFIVDKVGVLSPVSFGPRDAANSLSATNEFRRKSLVSIEEMDKYMGVSKFLYGWYVSDYTPLDCNLEDLGVMRAPQSWQYITLDV